MALQSSWIRRLRPADRSSEKKLFSKATDLSNDPFVKENEGNDGPPLASDVQSSKVADEGFVRGKRIAQVFRTGGSSLRSFNNPESYQKKTSAFAEVSDRHASEATAPQILSSDSKGDSGKNPQVGGSKQVLEKLQDLDQESKSSLTVRIATQPKLSPRARSLGNNDAENLATRTELNTEDGHEQNLTGLGPFRTSSRKPPLPPSKNGRIICRKALNRPGSNASQRKVVKFGSWLNQQNSLASKQRAVLAEDTSGKLEQHHGYGMEAGKSGAHSSSLGEMDFGKKLEVSLSGLDHFSPRLLASSLERCCGSMAIQSAWIQRLTPANRNSESKSSSKAWNMSNDRCVKLNQNLSLASDVQSDGYISSKKADKGSVERKCIAQLFERSRSPSLSFKKPKLYKEQIIVFDEGSERLASKPNALQLLSSDSKDVSGKNPQIEISKQLMENLKDLNEASINSPTQGSVAQPILSSKAGSRHRDPENSATHMELTRIPYEQNVVGFGPFRAGSRKPPLPQSDNSRIICSKAFDPPESHAFQYKVVKLGAWSKRKYSILSEASKPWPVLTEDRLGKLAQHHTVADIHYDNHEIQDAVQDLKMKRSTCNSVSKESGASVLGCSSASDNTKGPTAAYIPSRGVFFHLDFWNGDQAQIKSDLDQNRDREPWRLSAPSPQEKEEKALNIYNRGEPDAIAQSSLPENPILSCESGKAVIQSSTPGTTRACTPTLASFKHVINYEREPLASALALNADGNACKRSLLKRDADKDQWLDIAQTWFKRWCSPVANSIASSGNPVENRQNDSVNPPLNLQEVKSAHSRVKILGKYTKWRKCEEGLSTAKPFTKDSFVYHGFNLVSHSTSHPTLYFTPSVSALALASRMVKQVYTSSKARKFV